MKHFSGLVFLFVACTSAAQQNKDSLIQQFEIKNATAMNKLKLIMAEVKKIDTLHRSKDSLIVVWKNSKGKTLKRLEEQYRDSCYNSSSESYYNDLQQIYTEVRVKHCGLNKIYFAYTRKEYDTRGRVTKFVYRQGSTIRQRILYTYDKDGNEKRTIQNIQEYEFWN